MQMLSLICITICMEYSLVLPCFSISLSSFKYLCGFVRFFVSGLTSLIASSTEFAFPVTCFGDKAPPVLRLYKKCLPPRR